MIQWLRGTGTFHDEKEYFFLVHFQGIWLETFVPINATLRPKLVDYHDDSDLSLGTIIKMLEELSRKSMEWISGYGLLKIESIERQILM